MHALQGDCEIVRLTCNVWIFNHLHEKKLVEVELGLPRAAKVRQPTTQSESAELLPLVLQLVAAAQAQPNSVDIQTLAAAYEPLRAAVCKRQNVHLQMVVLDMHGIRRTMLPRLGRQEKVFLAGVPSGLLKYKEEIACLVLNCSQCVHLHEDLCLFSHLKTLELNGNESGVSAPYPTTATRRLHEQDFNGSLVQSCQRSPNQIQQVFYKPQRERDCVRLLVCVCLAVRSTREIVCAMAQVHHLTCSISLSLTHRWSNYLSVWASSRICRPCCWWTCTS